MPGVVLLLTIALVGAAVVWLLRRWPLPSTGLAGLLAAMLGLLLWRWPQQGAILFLGRLIRPDLPVVLFGQRLEMQGPTQWAIGFLALLLAIVYWAAWRISPGRSFFPFGLVLLTLLSCVLLIRPLWRAPLVLAAAMTMAVFVVQAGRQGSTRGALRTLWLPVLAIPLFLLAAWYVDQAPLDPDNPLPLQYAARWASWGLLLLLAPWPLHGPALSLGEEAPPLVAAWLLTALIVIPTTLLQAFLLRYEWLQGGVLAAGMPGLRLSNLLFWGGLALTLWSGAAAAVQNNLSRQWSYAGLFSAGEVLIALGMGARGSWGLVWLLILARSLGLVVSGFGLAAIRERAAGRSEYGAIQGFATRLPWASTAFLLGGLSLAGFPLTAGFAGQWALVQTLGTDDWVKAVVVLIGALGVAVGLVRSHRVLLGNLDDLLLEREDRWMIGLAGVGVLSLVAAALWPSMWQGILARAVSAFSVMPSPGR